MIGLWTGAHHSRMRRLRRRFRGLVSGGVGRLTGAVTGWARSAPLPRPLRRILARIFVWRPGTSRVPMDKILLGGQNGLSAGAFAQACGDLLWASRRVADGPHAQLLRLSTVAGPLDDREILASPYAALARACIASTGEFFSATDDAGILELARDFLDREPLRPLGPAVATRRHQSRPGDPILLAPIRDSDCFQVVDGHHRVAAGAHRGAIAVRARIRRTAVSTPLQDLLGQMSWIGGEHELYQPVAAPELETSWTTVRRCTDRMAAIDEVLAGLGLDPAGSSYLDVASCYGWFVSSMETRGYAAQGIERDPIGAVLGEAVYGLDRARITIGDAVDVLRESTVPWDVVSCFSLLHHFALRRASVDEVELLRLLDKVTGRVLFLDTGQAHEHWFRDSLKAWDTDHVRAFLEEHGTFDRVIDLGPDQDAVAPFERNYGRHLFACIRDR